MPQQQSPFLEGKYGWNFGESGWNTGMDENLLKFSFMFDRNVDGIVGSLPTAVNGQSYFLTTDNRLYFAVGTTWYSSPTPKWFEFKIKSTGEVYQFDGTAVTEVNSPSEIDSRLDNIELTITSLGTAAFEDIEFFATQSELDVAIANSASYTDDLRDDLLDDAGWINAKNSLSPTIKRTFESRIGDWLNVKDFGAFGDGASHPVSSRYSTLAEAQVVYPHVVSLTDELDWAALQLAINTAPNFRTVLLPGGIYRMNRTISVARGQIAIKGDGPGSTIIRRTDGSYGDTILVAAPDPLTTSLFDVDISNFRVESTVLMTAGAHIHAQEIGGCWFQNLRLLNGFKGFHLQGVRTSMFRNTLIQSGTHTASVQAGSSYVHIGIPANPASENTEIFFSDFNWEFTGNSRTMENGLLIEQGDGIWFNNGHIFSASNAVAHISSPVSSTQLIGVIFNQVWFDQLCDRNLQISGTGSGFGNLSFNFCKFWGADNYAVLISAGSTVQDIEFNACEFGKSNAAQAVDIFSGNVVSLTGCKFEQINQGSASAVAAYLLVRGSSTLQNISLKACTFKADNKLQHGVSLLNSSTNYGISANNFFDFSTASGSEINVTPAEIVGQIKGNTTDRLITVATGSTVTIPAILEAVSITGAATTINTINPSWQGRELTLRADTNIQTLSEAGNIVTQAGGNYAINATRATKIVYFAANDKYVQV